MLPSIFIESFTRLKFTSQIAAVWLESASLHIFTHKLMFALFSSGKNEGIVVVQGLGEHGSTGSPSGVVNSKHRKDCCVDDSSAKFTSTVIGAYNNFIN